MEMMRNNPAEFRRQQTILRMEERRLQSNSKSNSIENSRSSDQASLETKKRYRSRLTDEQRLRRIRNRRRRRRSKNCATKQPSYLWRKQNLQRQETARQNKDDNNKVRNLVFVLKNIYTYK